MSEAATKVEHRVESLKRAVVRFAGDSGDGIQLIGSLFTTETALAGNDLATLPNFPAEIRAPQGTTYGVSSFQIQFGQTEIFTPGDRLDTLVCFNAAALKVHVGDLKPGGILVVNRDGFGERDLEKAAYKANPLQNPELAQHYRVIPVDITAQTKRALEHTKLSAKEKDRAKNFWALGFVSWLYGRPLESTFEWARGKFKKSPEIGDANVAAIKAGFDFAETSEVLHDHYEIRAAQLAPGTYRAITGNTALVYGLVAAAAKSGKPLIYATYPITPASDILHDLSKLKNFRIRTLQMEDEIAAVGAAIGAAYAGGLGVTGTSGPGLALKSEAINLAVMAELPLLVINIQRGGPSTGLPTKTEQSDLLQALYGRNGESPVVVIAIATPTDAFATTFEAARIALKYMVPVILLSDAYIANGAEPWKLPDLDALPAIVVKHPTVRAVDEPFLPYKRDEATLARPWAVPGTPHFEHRIGGLEKQDQTGNVSYDPDNHERMTHLRAAKVARVRAEIPPTTVYGDNSGGLLVVGWGSTFGTIRAAVQNQRDKGRPVSQVHLKFINPLPGDLGDLLRRYDRVLVPEINAGQLVRVLRAEYGIDAQSYGRVRGLPLMQEDIENAIEKLLEAAR